MMDTKKKKLIVKLLIAFLIFLLATRLISLAYARYESLATSQSEVDVAFFLFHEDIQTMNLNLGTLFPSNTPNTYTFTISNNNGNKRAEVDIVYNLSIRMTTNLPSNLSGNNIRLFMNEVYTDAGATSIITSNTISYDEDGTYFRIITTDDVLMEYTTNETNTYQLCINLPASYKSINYQDIIEVVEITVNARQITDHDN